MSDAESHKKVLFTETEKVVLASLVAQYQEIEDKRNDNISLERKRKAWEELTKFFNMQPGVNRRSRVQLQKCLKNCKQRARKSGINLQCESQIVRDCSTPPVQNNPLVELVLLEDIPRAHEEVNCPWDSDATFSQSASSIVKASDSCVPSMPKICEKTLVSTSRILGIPAASINGTLERAAISTIRTAKLESVCTIQTPKMEAVYTPQTSDASEVSLFGKPGISPMSIPRLCAATVNDSSGSSDTGAPSTSGISVTSSTHRHTNSARLTDMDKQEQLLRIRRMKEFIKFQRIEHALQVEAERLRAEAEIQRAEAEIQRAVAERERAEAERQRAEAERYRAEAERIRKERYELDFYAEQ